MQTGSHLNAYEHSMLIGKSNALFPLSSPAAPALLRHSAGSFLGAKRFNKSLHALLIVSNIFHPFLYNAPRPFYHFYVSPASTWELAPRNPRSPFLFPPRREISELSLIFFSWRARGFYVLFLNTLTFFRTSTVVFPFLLPSNGKWISFHIQGK